MLVELMVYSAACVLVFVVLRHFKLGDNKELVSWKGESDVQFIVDEFAILESRIDDFKNASIVSFYIVTFLTLILIFALVISGTETSWYSMIEGVLWNYLVVWPVTSVAYFLLFSLRSLRSKTNTLPGFLFSHRFSQIKEFKLFINENGIDGRFSLLWSKVRKIERKGDELRIYYCRKPVWLSRLLRADSFRIRFKDESVALKVLDIWQSYGRQSGRI